MNEVTRILAAVEQGDHAAADELLRVVYDKLRGIAAARLSREKPGHTLQATALVNEAYLRLFGRSSGDPDAAGEPGDGAMDWQSRGHFFGAAAEAMRRILIESARSKKRLKRGGERGRVDLDDVVEMNAAEIAVSEPEVDLIELDEALTRLEAKDPEKASIVKLRYFAGLTIPETARAVGVSEPTVKRHWHYARAWLRLEMTGGDVEG